MQKLDLVMCTSLFFLPCTLFIISFPFSSHINFLSLYLPWIYRSWISHHQCYQRQNSRALPPLKTNHNNSHNIMTDLKKSLSSPNSSIRTPTFRTRRSMALVSSFTFVIMVCTMFFAIHNTHIHLYSEWLRNMIKNRSQIPPYFSHHLFHNNGSESYRLSPAPFSRKRSDLYTNPVDSRFHQNGSGSPPSDDQSRANQPTNDQRMKGDGNRKVGSSNDTVMSMKGEKQRQGGKTITNYNEKLWLEKMSNCDIFDGRWVKDNSPPLYEPGSCPYINEPFDCYRNGRPDNGYLRFRWQPNHCDIPRLDARKMLRFLRGKRIVYVGDSLNRNMWESMVCLLRNGVKDKSHVFEASGKVEFKKEGAYSFLFPDYNCSVEYVRSAFLVQEWEMPTGNSSKKETLRLDIVENSSVTYKDADVLIFNTGHWWTHEKTSQGKGYYQEGNHIHKQLDVVEAFHKAMSTWAIWMEANINPIKTFVFFRGYSLSHFSDGEWNSGGKCDNSREPIKDESDLLQLSQLHPPIPQMLEKSLKRLKTPVSYLNVTRLTNYRRDAHPSVYTKANMTENEKRMFLKHQAVVC